MVQEGNTEFFHAEISRLPMLPLAHDTSSYVRDES